MNRLMRSKEENINKINQKDKGLKDGKLDLENALAKGFSTLPVLEPLCSACTSDRSLGTADSPGWRADKKKDDQHVCTMDWSYAKDDRPSSGHDRPWPFTTDNPNDFLCSNGFITKSISRKQYLRALKTQDNREKMFTLQISYFLLEKRLLLNI